MYYLPFDRLMGLWIINEFFNISESTRDFAADICLNASLYYNNIYHTTEKRFLPSLIS